MGFSDLPDHSDGMDWTRLMARRTTLMKRSAVREILKITARPEIISFAGGLPAPELFPVEQIQQATAAVLRRHSRSCLQYGESEGLAELREWVARKFSTPEAQFHRGNVVITCGGQQALDLIGRVLLDDNDSVVVESPTYLALLAAWRPIGINFLPVRSDADGIRVDEFEMLLHSRRPKLIYLVPNFQNPQGTTVSLERRTRIVDLARQHEIAVVEDDPYGELRFSGESLPHLISIDRTRSSGETESGNVIYAGTFSKVLAPGLRVGWVIAPNLVIDKIVQAKQAADLHTSTLNQRITCELVQDDFLRAHIERLRQHYRERRDVMLSSLQKYFPNDVNWTKPTGGMFLLVTLPHGQDASELLRRSIQQNVAFVPGEEFHVDGTGGNTFRLNFSNAQPTQIEEGIKRLGALL